MLITGKAVGCNGFRGLISFYSFRFQYLYSSSTTHFLENYLVDTLGFSKQEATSASSKVIPSHKTLNNPNLVLTFLIKTGFNKSQIKNIVSRAPKLLSCKVSKTLKPKFQCLMDLGLSGFDLANVFVKGTGIIGRGLDTHLRPSIDCLKRILGSDDIVVKAIKKYPWLLSIRAHHAMQANVLLLKSYGFSNLDIKKHVLRNPRNIAQGTKWVKILLDKVEKDFRVPIDSPIFLYGFHVLASQKKSTLDKKIQVFKSFGWSDDYILEMFRKQPYCIAQSEVRIRKVLDFYMKELGFETAYLASHPSIMSYSLEKRVVPRMQVLKSLDEKKLKRRKLALYAVLCLTESKFIEHFVLPYKDQIPDLYESCKKTVAS